MPSISGPAGNSKRKKEQTYWEWEPAWELVDQEKWDQCHDGSIMRRGNALPTCGEDCYCGWTEAWENRKDVTPKHKRYGRY